MLIDFTVENFRSIKEPVTLSMVAQSRATGKSSTRAGVKPDDEIAKPYAIGNRGVEVLPAAGIFGANASGKSNVLFALGFLLRLMNASLSNAQWPYGSLYPFGLDQVSLSSPTRLEVRVALEYVIYCYSVSVTQRQIVREKLECLLPPPKQTRLLYGRSWDPHARRYVWENGPSFKGPHIPLESSVQPNMSFLSFLTNNLDVAPIRPLCEWLMHLMPESGREHDMMLRMVIEPLLYERPDLFKRVVSLVCRFDTGLSDVRIERTRKEEVSIDGLIPYEIRAVHFDGSGPVIWAFRNESTGTQKLLWLAAAMLLAFDTGTPVLLDDFGAGLHPEITETIVRMFQDERLNPKRAQLIFNSHDYTMMHGNLLRRDQVWFTQKRKDGSTELYPLTDFQPRNDLAIDKAYINGRFGAVPILPETEDLLPTEELVG